MADITLGDLLQWQRGLAYRAPLEPGPESGLDRPISWAVTIRVAPPILPPLRGGEIVVGPPRLLERLEAAEGIDRDNLVALLAEQPIAALLVDRSFAERPIRGVPLLVSEGGFPHDAESVLNRLLTERRAELYRHGSDLSRALSTATMAGAGLNALLDAAEERTGRPLALVNAEGALVAASHSVGERAPLGSHECAAATQATESAPRRFTDPFGSTWLAQGLRGDSAVATGRRGTALAILLAPNASAEVERLTLRQTAGAIELLLGQATAGPSRERGSRDALVADLLLGRLVSREAADARARLLGLDPTRPARVAVFHSPQPGMGARARAVVSEQRGRASVELNEREYAVVLTGKDAEEDEPRDLLASLRSLRSRDGETTLALSDPVGGAAWSHAALEEARLLARLLEAGIVDGPVARVGDFERVGVYALFLPLFARGELSVTAERARLTAFAGALLGPLEARDERRNSELVPTLDAYLACGGALAQAAERLDIHRNTLSYRLSRITELTGRDLGEPGTRLLLQLALAIRTLERAAR